MSAVIHYRGFIRDGVIVPEVPLPYVEGAAVTFDIQEVTKELTGEEKAKLFNEMIQAWREEDSKLSIEEQELLSKALEENRGLAMHRDLEDLLK